MQRTQRMEMAIEYAELINLPLVVEGESDLHVHHSPVPAAVEGQLQNMVEELHSDDREPC